MSNYKLRYSILAASLGMSMALTACTATKETKGEKAEGPEVKESASATHTEAEHWSYEGDTGPEHWGSLAPSNVACLNGTEQSPINIEISQVKADETLDDIEINYSPSVFSLANNGHTIQANPTDNKNSIIVDGTQFTLAQFHFHTPSEHQFNGQHFDMEMHLVHKDADGQLAVLGLMIKEGNENPYLADAWNALPSEKTEKDVQLAEAIDINKLLPQDKRTFRYNGSLTTPPCTEQVKWIILEQPIEMSKEQVDAFREIFEHNSRPVQSINDRTITAH